MKTEYSLQTIANSTRSISRITQQQAEFLANTINLKIDDLQKQSIDSELDEIKTKLTKGMFLIVTSY